MSDDSYVTHDDWLQVTGRPGHIDEVADQFERRRPTSAQHWPARSRGWLVRERLLTDERLAS